MKLSSKPKFLRTIRSFVRRSRRRTSAQKKAWDNYWPIYGVNPEIEPLDLSTLFENKNQKFVLEIGFGNGENLIDCARNDPYSNFSGIEVCPVDPWPKKKHHKRRLISEDFISLIESKLKSNGIVHICTDWADYAHDIHALFKSNEEFKALEQLPKRLRTKFERKGLALGHSIYEFAFQLLR